MSMVRSMEMESTRLGSWFCRREAKGGADCLGAAHDEERRQRDESLKDINMPFSVLRCPQYRRSRMTADVQRGNV